MSVAHDKLVHRVRTAMNNIGPEHLTLEELCRVVPILERAADREAGVAGSNNVITFADCRRRRARRLASRKQSGDAN
ncbi:hypothetical protein JF729_14615 [Mycobacterium intracellulare]|uniref:hypothetical protein n=1 Tax=Mycobacterium intracellulare TaxID=1767 RepID=UPI001CDA1B72|nr:hypothetical protein [Mycobacterium intracellulare]MCA2249015.1 hypothetical protein [Mycobacterium intracellulare]